MLTRRVQIANGAGLHARPAARFAAEARHFEAELFLVHEGKRGSCKSAIALMRLGLSHGVSAQLEATGPDAEAAVQRLFTFLDELAQEEKSACD